VSHVGGLVPQEEQDEILARAGSSRAAALGVALRVVARAFGGRSVTRRGLADLLVHRGCTLTEAARIADLALS
jgi:hypothetical protein